jgi:ubiquinone/menaquinone biosynthesis C-methylase UbiE
MASHDTPSAPRVESTTQCVRESYDRIAESYARRYSDELRHKPFDREVLDRFASETRGRGWVCDIGCGPGHIARYLRDAGSCVFGMDLSSQMIQEARKRNPDISFQIGDMLALDFRSESLAGMVGFYAIVNIPESSLPIVFSEMWRVLQKPGRLLLCFHIGDEVLSPREMFGQPISSHSASARR